MGWGACSIRSTFVRYLSGDRWRCSAAAEKRDDDEVSGAEAGACSKTHLPHRQAQTELAVILQSSCSAALRMTIGCTSRTSLPPWDEVVHISGVSQAQMETISGLFLLYRSARDPPVFTKRPKTTQVHRNRALILYSRSSFISITVIWINKRLRLVNSSEPNGSSCTSSMMTQYANYSSYRKFSNALVFCFRGVLTVIVVLK